MRIDRFEEVALLAYNRAPGVVEARPYRDGTARPAGIEVQLSSGTTVRHAMTMTTDPGEDLSRPEPVIEGEPPGPIEPAPQPAGLRDRETAGFLASILASAGHPEMARVYVYDEGAHPGLGVVMHSGRRIHMLLL